MYKIMFVDDEEQNLFLMEKILDWEEIGFRVCGIALDGEEGIKVYEETEPDVVCVDIRMDEMDGLTLIRELQKKGRKCVFIIVTAYSEFSYAQTAIKLGVKNYLLKPISRKEMIPMMKEIKKELDENQKKEMQSLFFSQQYKNTVFADTIAEMEKYCFEKKKEPQLEYLDEIIEGRNMRGIELFSEPEDIEDFMPCIEKWPFQYKTVRDDCLYGIILEDQLDTIQKAFEDLVKKNMKNKIFMQINPSFHDKLGFQNAFIDGFQYRRYCFYCKESMIYDIKKIQWNFTGKLTYDKTSLEKAVQGFIYSGSPKEIMKMIEEFENQSAEKLVSPDILTDTWIEILISIKNQLTKTYQDRAFMVLRHQNLWALHQIRTQKKLFIKMKNLVEEVGDAVTDIIENKESYSLMGKIVDYMLQHYSDKNFSAGEVAEAVHLSRNYFLKIFKEEQGISFWDYVTNLRMEKAKKLLKTSDMTVYAISREVGYESQYHFSRKFKNLYNISPNEYRNL